MNRRTKNTAAAIWLVFIFKSAAIFSAEPELSGVLDTTVNYTAGAGEAQAHSWGIEEAANLRLRVRTGERAALNTAVNLIALSGNYLENPVASGGINPNSAPVSTPVIYGQNYAAALELERLYFRINGDFFDTEAGLFRIPLGYGQVWGSSDFLNPRNPIFPNARSRGVLGAAFFFYPGDSFKITAFAAAPKNPLEAEGGGFIPGLSFDSHWDTASLQILYAFETALEDSKMGLHRFGLSFKADLELGLVADALYTFDPADACGIEGLSAGAGFDYSFFDGDFYVLAEYLFNGSSSATAFDTASNLSGRKNHNYLYGTLLYRFNDYSSLALSSVFCFDDISFSPFLTFEYEFFQGFLMSLTARFPLDRKALSDGLAGELGPVPPGSSVGARAIINAGLKLRF